MLTRTLKRFSLILPFNSSFPFSFKCLILFLFQRKSRGAAEFSWNLFNFQKDQDIRLRLGYEIFEQVLLSPSNYFPHVIMFSVCLQGFFL